MRPHTILLTLLAATLPTAAPAEVIWSAGPLPCGAQSIQYAMFNPDGVPVRAKVSLQDADTGATLDTADLFAAPGQGDVALVVGEILHPGVYVPTGPTLACKSAQEIVVLVEADRAVQQQARLLGAASVLKTARFPADGQVRTSAPFAADPDHPVILKAFDIQRSGAEVRVELFDGLSGKRLPVQRTSPRTFFSNGGSRIYVARVVAQSATAAPFALSIQSSAQKGGTDVAIEELTLAHEGFELPPASAIGPLPLCSGQPAELTVYNHGPRTAKLHVDLLDVTTGKTIDARTVGIPAGRADQLAFHQDSVATESSCDTPMWAAVRPQPYGNFNFKVSFPDAADSAVRGVHLGDRAVTATVRVLDAVDGLTRLARTFRLDPLGRGGRAMLEVPTPAADGPSILEVEVVGDTPESVAFSVGGRPLTLQPIRQAGGATVLSAFLP